jgi:hypothetical protein
LSRSACKPICSSPSIADIHPVPPMLVTPIRLARKSAGVLISGRTTRSV